MLYPKKIYIVMCDVCVCKRNVVEEFVANTFDMDRVIRASTSDASQTRTDSYKQIPNNYSIVFEWHQRILLFRSSFCSCLHPLIEKCASAYNVDFDFFFFFCLYID